MKLETKLKGALPSGVMDKWTDQHLAAIFASGVNFSGVHHAGNMDRWLNRKDAVLDFEYIQAQLAQGGLDVSGVLSDEVFRSFHGLFDIRPVVAAFQRELRTWQSREQATEVLPPLETFKTSAIKGNDRLNTFIGALMRHSYVPQPRATNPNLYRRLQSLNPVDRVVDQIVILQLPSITPPPKR